MTKIGTCSSAALAVLALTTVFNPGLGVSLSWASETTSAPIAEGADFDLLYSRGQGGFQSNCSSCHGAAGQGDAGPALVGNDLLADTRDIVRTVIHGYSYMPPFGDVLNDDQVAAILTYIRNSWGNDFGIVTPEQSAAER